MYELGPVPTEAQLAIIRAYKEHKMGAVAALRRACVHVGGKGRTPFTCDVVGKSCSPILVELFG